MANDEIDRRIEAALSKEFEICEADDCLSSPSFPLSPEEIKAAAERLTLWRDVTDFKREVDQLCSRCGSKDWFNRPQLKFLHDAYILARFATDVNCEDVALVPLLSQWPDGYIRRGGKTHNIEIVSTHGGRKLGEEHKDFSGARFDPVSDWIKRAESIAFYLDQAINKKVCKHPGSPCWLVVYLNIDEWGIRQKEVEPQIAKIKYKYANKFEAISVRWKGSLY